MKIVSVSQNLIITKWTNIKQNVANNVMSGNCKGFKSAIAEYSEFAVNNFDIVKDTLTMSVESDKFELRKFRNMLKIVFLNIFRKKALLKKSYWI